MRYLLVVGFACEVLKQEPLARIFLGGKLVDEFLIPHTPSNFFTSQQQFRKRSHLLQPFELVSLNKLLKKKHSPLKFYELQFDDKITNLDLRINICNHDSNYSNGFMTRSTLIRLEECVFFPLKTSLLQRLEKIKTRRRISKNYAWYQSYKNHIFDLTLNGICWQGANGQKITPTPSISFRSHDIGGDGAFVCELTKKYGILLPTLVRACRHSFLYPNYLLDKYQQHAHQRDRD